MKYEPSEYDKFTSLVDRVLSVPHSVIKERVEAERKAAANRIRIDRDRSQSRRSRNLSLRSPL